MCVWTPLNADRQYDISQHAAGPRNAALLVVYSLRIFSQGKFCSRVAGVG